jgi:hypothetical protein
METNQIMVTDEDSFGIGNTPEEAYEELKRKISYTIEFEDLTFYKIQQIKVRQELIIVDND